MGPWTRRLAGAALLLLVGTDAAAQYFGRNKVQYDDPEMRVLATEHFDIYHAADEDAAARLVGRLAERWHARLGRVLRHRLSGRQPIVLYGSHRDFEQTNLVPGLIEESTGGFTESRKRRIVLPFAATLGETDHVLGHEIVHAFQYDIADRHRTGLAVPLWFVEGMAEYLSLGPDDPLTAMWMRDAVRQETLPSIRDLAKREYFPYRWGAALWSYLARRFGADVPGAALRTRRSAIRRLEAVTGLEADELAAGWHAALRDAYGQAPDENRALARQVIAARRGGGRLNLGSAISPDGSRIIFLSERDQLSVDVFLADAASGRVITKLITTAARAEFESLQYLHSSGSWDPSGRRFALATVGRGRPALTILEVDEPERREDFSLDGLDEAYSPSWSPDGGSLAFSGLKAGTTDLYTMDLETRIVRRLTADLYSDLDPAWSPDGRSIAFASDRFTTDVEALRFGPPQIAVLNLDTRAITAIAPDSSTRQIDPAWSPDGASVFFVSDRGDSSDVFRARAADGELFQVTRTRTGVSGVTRLSPALSIARDSGTLAFSLYRNGAYEIRAIDLGTALSGTLVERSAPDRRLAPDLAGTEGDGEVAQLEPAVSLPDVSSTSRSSPYASKLALEGFGQPYFSAGGGVFGEYFRAGGSMFFADLLGDRQLYTAVEVSNRLAESAVHAVYLDRRTRWNWGFGVEQVPDLRLGQRRSTDVEGEGTVSREHLRLLRTHRRATFFTAYPWSRWARVEFHAGFRQITFAREGQTQVFSADTGKLVDEFRAELPSEPALLMGETGVAFVRDTTVFGATGPVLGSRYRVQVSPTFGSISLATVLADYRQYVMPVRPYTLAFRVVHSGRYGGGADDPRLRDGFVGTPGLVRGYGSRTVVRAQCGGRRTDCAALDRLVGNRLLVGKLELRVPVLGAFSSRFRYGLFPVDALLFVDAGTAWGGRSALVRGQGIASSVGGGVRVNATAFVVEVSAVRPLTLPGAGWSFAVDMRPGF